MRVKALKSWQIKKSCPRLGYFLMCLKSNVRFTLKLFQLSIQWHSKLSLKNYMGKKARNSGLHLSICRQTLKDCYQFLDSLGYNMRTCQETRIFSNTKLFLLSHFSILWSIIFPMRKGVRSHVESSFFFFLSKSRHLGRQRQKNHFSP